MNDLIPPRLPLGPATVLAVLRKLDEPDRGAWIKNLWPTISDRHLVLMVRYPAEIGTDDRGLVLPASWNHAEVKL